MVKFFLIFFLIVCTSDLIAQVSNDSNNTKETIKINKREVPDSLVNYLKSHDDYWYINNPPVKEKKQKIRRNEAPGFRVSKEFRRIMWIIIIVVFISVILIYITKSNIHLFKSSSQKIKIENESEIGENIYTINYEKELQAATANRNFRLAVRLLYLQIIKKLADKNLIDFKPHKTNSDYLTQLSSSHLYKDFSRLTRSFEYIWYGGFQMSEEAFTGVQNDFFQFKNKLN